MRRPKDYEAEDGARFEIHFEKARGFTGEDAASIDIFHRPTHPYTQGLLNASPQFAVDDTGPRRRLAEIAGIVPTMDELPAGCAFAARCPRVEARCRTDRPRLSALDGARQVACLVAEDEAVA